MTELTQWTGVPGEEVLPRAASVLGVGSFSGRLLIVDDDTELCSMLVDLFRQQDFLVETEPDGDRGLARALAETFDLLVLDVMLPGLEGFEALRRLREKSRVPVLMLTARGGKEETVRGLQLGADDYLAKPFDPDELLARVRAILRRVVGSTSDIPEALQVGELRLFRGSREAYFRGRPLGLTATECEILEQLMRSCGRAVSRDQFAFALYNRLASPFERAVDTHVSRLRHKLGEGGRMILSVRGTGYQLSASPELDTP